MRIGIVFLARCLGWLALGGSTGLFLVVTLWQTLHGPADGQALVPDKRLQGCLITTVTMAVGAAVLGLIFALPAAWVLSAARRPVARALVSALTILPLVTMPSVFSYAWLLIATTPGAAGDWLRRALAWEAAGVRPYLAAGALAAWLWPIPAMILAAAYRREGRGIMRLALLDAGPATALCRAVFPALRGPIFCSLVIVFMIAATEGASPAILGAMRTWPYEMKSTQAVLAWGSDRPAAYMAVAEWPMLALLAAALLLAWPAIARMARWGPPADLDNAGGGPKSSRWVAAGAVAAVLLLSAFPILVFVKELATGRAGMSRAFDLAWRVYQRDGLASIVAALLTATAAVAAAVSLLEGPLISRRRRALAAAASVIVLIVAASPPELIVAALTPAFVRVTDPARWNVYDDTPAAWVAAMLVRLAFIAVWIARLAGRRIDPDLDRAAATDGASPIQVLAHVRLPQLARPLAVAAVVTTCLVLADISTSVGVQPSRFLGGSLAVRVDQQMHFGRNDEVVACSLMLMIPAALAAALVSIIAARRERPPRRASARAVGALALCMLAPLGCAPDDRDAGAVRHVFGGTGLGPGEFSYPRALAVSPVDGCVFVVDKTARIQRFSPDGRYQHGWRMPQWEFGKPTGLWVDPAGRVWVPDTHYARVIVYDRDGAEQFRFGENGRGPGQFIFPTHVVVDREGFIYVGEYGGNDRISKFTPDRQFLFSFGTSDSGEAALARPTDLIFDEQDQLWVADACNYRICRFSRDGTFLSDFPVAGPEPDRLSYPFGMCLERGGTLVIADQGNHRILRYDRAGRMLASWGSTGRALGQVSQPWDVGVGRDGLVYILDSWNNRVQVIDW